MTHTIVFAARQAPIPLLSGAPIRRHRLLTGLGETFDTVFVTFEQESTSADYRATRTDIENLLPGIRVAVVEGFDAYDRKRRRQLRSLASQRSWEFGRYRVPAYRTLLEETVAETGAALVHFDDPGVAQWGPVAGVANAFAPHNVEYRILQGTARSAHGARRIFASLEWRKLAREERRIWRAMPLCLAVSEDDAAEMRAGGARRVELCPNGADAVEPLPPALRRGDEPLRILFVGVVHYQPNYRGLVWFIEEVLPLVRSQLPCQFDVVGALHDAPPPAPDDVRFHGAVPSLESFYRDAHVVVVPIRYGSGTRMKVLEAMAYGRPVVSTSVGVQGLPVRPEAHYHAADDAQNFADALVRLGDASSAAAEKYQQLVARARKGIEPLLWPNIIRDLASLYRAEIEGSARREAVATRR
jgi:glycosyltransferase involved in cell wall biosynthesis